MLRVSGHDFDINLDIPEECTRVFQAIDKVETAVKADLENKSVDATQWPTLVYGHYQECFTTVFGEAECKKILGDSKSLRAATEAWNDLKDAVFDYSESVNSINTAREERRAARYGADKIAER